MHSDWVRVVEAIYDVELPDAQWRRALVEAALPCMPHADVALVYSYDASDPARFSWGGDAYAGQVERFGPLFKGMMAVPLSAEYISATYRRMRAASVVETLSAGAPVSQAKQYKAITGFADVHLANGVDVDGHGLWLGGGFVNYVSLTDEQRQSLARVAAHLNTGWRLRRRLTASGQRATEGASAVFGPGGALKHAEGPARTPEARATLSEAARAVDAARTRSHRRDPARGLAEWRGLVARRWSLLEVLERDGRRFLVARENTLPGDERVALTRREYEVVALAALELTNTLVAYELGISAATVGVLLHRAMKKLGVTSRAALRTHCASLAPPSA